MEYQESNTVTTPTITNYDQAAIAAESSQLLAKHLNNHQDAVVVLKLLESDKKESSLKVPIQALGLLQDILIHMANGQEVTLLPNHAELSTQQAADILNISRPFFVQILEKNELPYRKVGTHRRVYLNDVLTYKAKIDAKRQQVLQELAEQAQELDMGY